MNPVESILAEDAHLSEWFEHHTGEHLAVVADSALANFLRISDVEGRGLIKAVVDGTILIDLLHELFATKWDLSAHSILSRNHILTQTVEHGLVATFRVAGDQGHRAFLSSLLQKRCRREHQCQFYWSEESFYKLCLLI